MRDAVGAELKVGDAVVIKLDHVVGIVSAIENDGGLANAQGQAQMPTIGINIGMQTALAVPHGIVQQVVKVAGPDKKTEDELKRGLLAPQGGQ